MATTSSSTEMASPESAVPKLLLFEVFAPFDVDGWLGLPEAAAEVGAAVVVGAAGVGAAVVVAGATVVVGAAVVVVVGAAVVVVGATVVVVVGAGVWSFMKR